MITVYIWHKEGCGHASMKITRQAGTKYYSWWPSAGAGLLSPRGRAGKNSEGYGHVRRNPVAYGDSKLAKEYDEGRRKINSAPHFPGGGFAYNRSDKDMESVQKTNSEGEPMFEKDGTTPIMIKKGADTKFYFRPWPKNHAFQSVPPQGSTLNAERAEVCWDQFMRESTTQAAKYHFLTNNCSTTTMSALAAASSHLNIKKPKLVGQVITPDTVRHYCIDLANYLNNNLLLWDGDLPPVVAALEKGEQINRFVDPSDMSPVVFPQGRRQEPHP